MRNAILTLLLFGLLAAHANPAAFYGGLTAARLRGNAAEPWTPADLTGLALWLDASDASTLWADTNATTAATNNGLVARWDDKSGSGYHATQPTNSLMPTVSGGKLYFDGTDDFLMNRNGGFAGAYSGADKPLSMFTVFNLTELPTSSANRRAVWQVGRSSSTSPLFSFVVQEGPYYLHGKRDDANNYVGLLVTNYTVTSNQMLLEGVVHNGTASSVFANGAQVVTNASQDVGTLTLNQFSIGRQVYGIFELNPWKGQINEIVGTFSALSTTDRQKLEGYLAHKWGMVDKLPADHPYKSAAPTK